MDWQHRHAITNAGHMVQLEASNEVNDILLDYRADIQAQQ